MHFKDRALKKLGNVLYMIRDKKIYLKLIRGSFALQVCIVAETFFNSLTYILTYYVLQLFDKFILYIKSIDYNTYWSLVGSQREDLI